MPDDIYYPYGFAYRCSACNELVHVENVRPHIHDHQMQEDFTGQVTLTREDQRPADHQETSP